MRIPNTALMLLILPGTLLFAAGPPAASIADVQDHALSQVEKEIVSLAEAMPADKYDFAPTQGTFQGVRTFGQQMSHVAVVLDEVAAGMLGEKEPDTGQSENGPASLKGKDAIVAYLKSAFERAHRAVKTLTVQNLTEPVKLSWGSIPRASLAELMAVHTMDHYGQAVVYARMNNVVPPASRS